MTRKNYPELQRKWRRNLLSIYRSADAASIRAGLTWYQDAHEWCAGRAEDYGLSVLQSAGVVAALSPSLPWERNTEQADRFMAEYASGQDPRRNGPWGIYGRRNTEKAYAMIQLSGIGHTALCASGDDPIAGILGYHKVRSFFYNIARPDLPFVTVDGHTKNAAENVKQGSQNGLVGRFEYGRLTETIQELAAKEGLTPNQFQAIIWCEWKRRTSE